MYDCVCEQTLNKNLQYSYTVVKPSKVIRPNIDYAEYEYDYMTWPNCLISH